MGKRIMMKVLCIGCVLMLVLCTIACDSKCRTCSGEGKVACRDCINRLCRSCFGDGKKLCDECAGFKKVIDYSLTTVDKYVPCTKCDYNGYIPCLDCGMDGWATGTCTCINKMRDCPDCEPDESHS